MIKRPGKSIESHLIFPAFLSFIFTIKTDKLIYGQFEAENITGQVEVEKTQAFLKNISMGTMSGQMILNGTISDAGSEQIRTVAHASLKGIDVKQCFIECDNFGQTYITDKYIQGRLDAEVDYSALLNKDYTIDTKSIVCDADLTIYDGNVNQFPQFIRLGKFLKVKSLDNINFSEYSNHIYIRNRTVEIPKMDIKSSAVNITLAGTHTFNNVMDYKMKVNITQLLFGAKKDYEDQFGEVEVDKNGGLNVFLTMKGPVDNYEIKYDATGSIKNMGSGFKDEKTEIQKIFRSNSPNAKPNENLNKTSTDFDLSTGSNDSNSDENDGVPPKKKNSGGKDTTRKNAFDLFKKKLKKSQ